MKSGSLYVPVCRDTTETSRSNRAPATVPATPTDIDFRYERESEIQGVPQQSLLGYSLQTRPWLLLDRCLRFQTDWTSAPASMRLTEARCKRRRGRQVEVLWL